MLNVAFCFVTQAFVFNSAADRTQMVYVIWVGEPTDMKMTA
jgi:hypothetical protein